MKDNKKIEFINPNDYYTEKGMLMHDKFSRDLIKGEQRIISINGILSTYSDGIYKSCTTDIEKNMIKRIPRLRGFERKEVLSYLNLIAESYTDNDINKFSHLIAFRNGIYNILTQQLEPFNPDYILINKIDWDYNPDAKSPLVDKMFLNLADGDEKIRDILFEIIGYCFYRRNELGKAAMLVGEKSNGKSTYQDIVLNVLGRDNTTAMDLSELSQRFKPIELYGKLANIGDDIKDDYIDDTSNFKILVTGGRISGERKYQNTVDFYPYAKFIFSANNIPKTRDKTGAVKRRLVIVPFTHTFSPSDADFDPYIKYKILNGTPECSVDTHMSYIINMALAGLHNILKTHGFTESEKVNAAIEDYDRENNPIKFFFEEYTGNGYTIVGRPTQEVFDSYVRWCENGNQKAMSKIEFTKAVCNTFSMKTSPRNVNGTKTRCFVKG